MFVTFGALAIAGVGIAETQTVARIVTAQQELIAAGGNVIIARGAVDAIACDALTQFDEVIGATAAFREPQAARLGMAGERLSLTHLTTGVSAIVALSEGRWPIDGEVVAAEDTAEDRDYVTGRRFIIATPGKEPAVLVVSGVADLSRLGEEFSSGVAVPTSPDTRANACIIETTTPAASTFEPILAAQVSGPNELVHVTRRIPSSEFRRDYTTDYATRSTRVLWLPVGLAIALFWSALLATRRSERGLYASNGASAATITVIYLSELLISVTGSVALASLISILWAGNSLQQLRDLTEYGARPGALATLVVIATGTFATATAPRKPISEIIKDR